jgi:hypothetical protein
VICSDSPTASLPTLFLPEWVTAFLTCIGLLFILLCLNIALLLPLDSLDSSSLEAFQARFKL